MIEIRCQDAVLARKLNDCRGNLENPQVMFLMVALHSWKKEICFIRLKDKKFFKKYFTNSGRRYII